MIKKFIEDILKHPSISSLYIIKDKRHLESLRKIILDNFLVSKLENINRDSLHFLASDASSRTLKFANPFEIILHTVVNVCFNNETNFQNIDNISVYALRPGKDIDGSSKLFLIFEEIEKYIQYPIKSVLQEKLVFLELLSLFKKLKIIKDKNTLALSDGSYEINLKKALLFLIRKEKVDKYLDGIYLSDTEKYHKEIIFDNISKKEIADFESNLKLFLEQTLFVPKKLTSFYILENIKRKLEENIKNIFFDKDTPLLDDLSLVNILLEDGEYLVLEIPYNYIEDKFYLNVLKNKYRELNLDNTLFRLYLKTKHKVFVFEGINSKLFKDNITSLINSLLPFLEEDGEVYPIKLADRFCRDISKKIIKELSSILKTQFILGLNYREHDTDY